MRSSHVAKSLSAVVASLVLAALPVTQGAVMAAEPTAQTSPSAPDIRSKQQQAAAGAQSANADAARDTLAGQPDRQPAAGSGASRAGSAGPSAASAPAGSLAQRAPEAHGSRTQTLPNQLIVTYKDSSAFRADTVAAGVGRVVKEHQARNSRLLQVNDAAAARNALAADANVSSVEENQVALPMYSVPDDPYVPNEWHLFPFFQTHGVDVANRSGAAAWDLTRGASRSDRIAFLDTGLDWTHPDLSPKSPLGYNFAEQNYAWGDCYGHGTATAGTAAAAGNNRVGVSGIDQTVPLYEAKIVTGCTGSSDYFTMGWALDTASQWPGTKVINISFGGYGYSPFLCSAAANAEARNVLVVASAGNDNTNTAVYPAACPGVVGVGATDPDGNRAYFSNFGNPDAYVSAPGQSILTTNMDGGYGYWSGTSFSAPIVSGIASLTVSRYPSIRQSTLRSWLAAFAYNPQCGWGCYTDDFGYGIPDAYYVAI